jgi:hypothetical protein
MRITISDLITRLQIAKEVLKSKDYNAQIMTCGNCDSTHINKVAENENAVHYIAQYVCENCGCHCIETQNWETLPPKFKRCVQIR